MFTEVKMQGKSRHDQKNTLNTEEALFYLLLSLPDRSPHRPDFSFKDSLGKLCQKPPQKLLLSTVQLLEFNNFLSPTLGNIIS